MMRDIVNSQTSTLEHKMPIANPRKLFVNLAVKDLPHTMEFFSRLGFEFNRQFTDD